MKHCNIVGCKRPASRRGMCVNHYQSLRLREINLGTWKPHTPNRARYETTQVLAKTLRGEMERISERMARLVEKMSMLK